MGMVIILIHGQRLNSLKQQMLEFMARGPSFVFSPNLKSALLPW